MDHVTVLSDGKILIDGIVYKRVTTTNGKYSKAKRSEYQREYRIKQKTNNQLTNVIPLYL